MIKASKRKLTLWALAIMTAAAGFPPRASADEEDLPSLFDILANDPPPAVKPAAASILNAPEQKGSDSSETAADGALAACGADCASGHGGSLIGGADLYLVKPFFANNPAVTFFTQDMGPGRREDVAEHLGAAPLFWLGYVDDSGLGFRARWFTLNQGTGQNYAFTPPSSGTLTVLAAAPLGATIIQNNPKAFAVTSKLQLNVIDLEMFQNASYCRWNFQFAGGLSYAEISQSYNAFATASSGDAANPLASTSKFQGLGPVLALEASRPICSCFSLYSSVRSRLLFGTSKQTVIGGDELNGSQISSQDGIVSIEELELGVQYNRCVGRSTVFGRIGMVGQEWFGASNASGSSRSGPPTTIPNFSSQDTSNFGLFGVAFRMGVNY